MTTIANSINNVKNNSIWHSDLTNQNFVLTCLDNLPGRGASFVGCLAEQQWQMRPHRQSHVHSIADVAGHPGQCGEGMKCDWATSHQRAIKRALSLLLLSHGRVAPSHNAQQGLNPRTTAPWERGNFFRGAITRMFLSENQHPTEMSSKWSLLQNDQC